jgi:phosphohistidine phosphatase
MNLYILRHAIAEERNPDKFPNDAKRPLTDKGAKRMRRIAEGLRALGLEFDMILSSSYTRAKQTAEIVAKEFGAEDKLKFSKHLETGDGEKLIDQINTLGTIESVLLVGHEPDLSELISVLLVGDSRLPLTMKKGGLCKLTVGTLKYGQCASLEWLVPPSVATHLQKK